VSERSGDRRPSVVFLNRFYWPDVAATAQMLSDLAEDLAADGWDVRVITSQASYNSGSRLPTRETHNGVTIQRVRGTMFGRGRALGRLADYASYILGALVALFRVPRGSVVVGMTDPPLIATLAVVAAALRRGRSVYWVQDVFPDVAVELGVVARGGLLHRVLNLIARWVYRRSDLVVALGPAMAEALRRRGVPHDRVTVIHNWADVNAIVPIPPENNRFLAEQKLLGRFVILYSGNAGRATISTPSAKRCGHSGVAMTSRSFLSGAAIAPSN
jgi:colanic acid biosynthesis glycosyl transferase WcaI